MPDITMCRGTEEKYVCPAKDDCYRFLAVPSQGRQSFFLHLPIVNRMTGGCPYFWKAEPGDKR